MSGLCSLHLLDERLGRDVDAEVVDREARALEHDVDEVLADVVDVALDGAHHERADLARAGLGQQRAQDVERALHRARGDQHLRNEVVAPLEAGADLLERRDQRVVEHRLGPDAVRESLLDEVAHLGRVPDQRVVVQPLQDLLVRHAAPRASSWYPSRCRQRARLLDEERREPGDALGGQAGRRPGDRERGDRGAVRAEHGRGHRRQSDLELVDARRVAAGADLLQGGRELAGARGEGEEALAVGGLLEGHAAPDPVGDADEVSRVLLRQVLDTARAGNGEVDRLAGRVGESPQARLRRARRVVGGAVARARSGAARARGGAGRGRRGAARAPAARGRRRASTSCSFGSPERSASSLTPSGRGDSTTRTSSCRRAVDRLGAGLGRHRAHIVEHAFHARQAATRARGRTSAVGTRPRRPRCAAIRAGSTSRASP